MNDVYKLSAQELAAAMREAAAGCYAAEAAVELLVAHGFWLDRPDFRRYVDYSVDGSATLGSRRPPMARVSWYDLTVAGLPASPSATNVLRIAASLSHVDAWLSLRDVSKGLDPDSLRAVVQALIHAGGYPKLAAAIGGVWGEGCR